MQGNTTTLTLRLLGRPAITLDHQPLTNFVSEKAISLFCYLVANQKLHARETLASLFWSNLPEKRAKANLRLALHNINSLCPGYFDISRKTVRFLHNQPHWLDLDRFSELIQSGEIGELQTAVALYRDHFMHGITLSGSPEFEQWVGGMSEFYRRKQIDGLQTIIEHFVAQERWKTATHSLVQLLQLEPWNENGHRQLMTCYAYQGEFDNGIRQFQTCQEALWQELEVEPTADTLSLAQRIRTARLAPKHNIRPPAVPFIGRQKDRAALRHLLKKQPIVTIAGLGGIGKTRLAMQVGVEQADRFLNGVLFVPLSGVPTEPNGRQAIAEAIVQAAISAGRLTGDAIAAHTPEQACIELLHQQELLLILDNFEHLIPHAPLVADLQKQLPSLTVLITSRSLLNLRGEAVVRLSGLNSADGLADSLALFHQVAQLNGTTLSRDDESSIIDICQLVSGHPLALELAADLTSFQACAHIAAQLKGRIDSLSSSQIDQNERQKSIEAVLDTSWAVLTPSEQAVLLRLACFQDSFTFDAAEAATEATRPILHSLGQKSLISFQDGRYQLHPLLRRFLLDKNRQTAETTAAIARFYLARLGQMGDEASRFGPIRIEQALRLDLENISAAWRWAVAQDIHRLTPIVHHMQSLFSDRGIHTVAQNLVDLALPAAEKSGNQPLILGLKLQQAYYLFWQAKMHDDAFHLLNEIEPTVLQTGQSAEHGYYHLIRGWYFQYRLGEMEKAAGHFLQAKESYAELGYHKQVVGRWLDLGNVAYAQSELDAAERCWLAGLKLCEQHEITLGRAILKFSLSQIELKRQNRVGAKAYLLEAQPLSGYHVGLDHAIWGGLGEIAVMNQDFDEALARFQAQFEAAGQIGQLHEMAAAHCNLGRLYLTLNRPEKGENEFRQAACLAKMYDSLAVLQFIEAEIEKGAF